MSKQTINIGASPNDGTGTPLRTSFDYTNQNFTEIYTALGGGVALPGATTQVIFNDGGTNLAGDAGLVYNKTTDALTVAGLVTAGSATITGDLTVDTTTLKVDSTNNRVIVGHTSGSSAFQVSNAGGAGLEVQPTGVNSAPVILSYNRSGSAYTQLTIDAANYLYNISGSTGMILNSTGHLGLGVTPSTWSGTFKMFETLGGSFGTNSNGALYIPQNATFNAGWLYKNTLPASYYAQSGGVHQFFNAPSGTAGNTITFTQAMTLDASGRLLVGQTSTGLLNLNGIDIEGGDSNGGSYIIINHKLATVAGQQYAFFAYNGVKTGDITQNGTTGVLYNTVSDYRLKESVKPISNGLARVNSLKPSSYNWKSDGSVGEGFIAHELAEAVPAAVSGEKDALNADGSIKAQSVDMSRIIPILVAAIQELAAEVNALKNA